MADQIRVLIVDDIPETRDHLAKLLGFESDIEVVGVAASGREALEVAGSLTPDIVLMDINMPDMDGIAATERLASEVPTAAVVMMSVQGEADYLRRSMLAGAREFLVKPFSSDELTSSIRQVYTREREKQSRIAVQPAAAVAANAGRPVQLSGGGEDGEYREPGRVIAVFGPKGGVGRTTLAVNLAVAAATELGQRTCLVDGSFQFGDIGVLLNLNPKNKSIADLIPEMESGADIESLDTFLINHSAGIHVLLAPPSPEMAELITPAGAKRMVESLRRSYDLVIVDCMSSFNDTTLSILDQADTVLTMLSLEITSIKNIRLFLEVAEQLGYGSDKVRLVLNRADSSLGIRVADVEHSIGRRVDHTIVSDGRSVVYALNRGVPFFLSNREAQVSQDVLRLAQAVVGAEARPSTGEAASAAAKKGAQKKSLFAWR
jgi:pilus assembly protein CpaE